MASLELDQKIKSTVAAWHEKGRDYDTTNC